MLSKRSTPLIKANKDLILDSITNTRKGGPPEAQEATLIASWRSKVVTSFGKAC